MRSGVLKEKQPDKISVLLDSAANKKLDTEARYLYTTKALQILSTQKNDSLNRSYYIKVANRFYNIDATREYKSTTIKLIEHATNANDTIVLAKALSYLGDYYADRYVSDSALIYYVDAEKFYRSVNDYSKVAAMLVNKATLQLNEKDYVGSEKSAYEAVKVLRKVNNSGLRYDAYNLLGIIYTQLEEFDTALNYHKKALEETRHRGFSDPVFYQSSTFNNLGVIFLRKKNYTEAQKYFLLADQSETLFQDNPEHYIHVQLNIQYTNLKLNPQLQHLNDFQKLLKISDSLNIASGMISTRLSIGEYYLLTSDSLLAQKYTLEAYKVAKFHKMTRDELLSLTQLSQVFPKKAANFNREYIKISDSIQIAERKVRNKLGRIEYETAELAIEKENLIESRKKIIYVSFSIILLGIFAYIIRIQSAKNRELRLVQEQQKANEEIFHLMISQQDKVEEERQKEKKRIAQELHDGVLGKLFGTRMNLGILNDSRNDNTTVAHRGAFIEDLKTIEQELREISHDLSREQQAVQNNFVLMVSNFIESQRTVCPAGISYSMDNCIIWAEVGNNTKINLYRILQEAFQNINKHSQASAVSVVFEQSKMGISLLIADNGVGFNYSKKRNGIGLQNMQNRISNSAGTMKITTTAGSGTELYFDVPLNPA